MTTFSLKQYGLTVKTIHRNLSPAKLYEEALTKEPGTQVSSTGALVVNSGKKTGRSPNDKRVVKNPESEKDVWWGKVNVPMEPHVYDINRKRAVEFLNTKETLYCFDGFAGWDPATQIKVRIICSRPYHALFMHTMLIRPTPEQLESFGQPDLVIINAGQFKANPTTEGMTSETSIDLNIEKGEMVILGTEYAGEMKKGVFTVMNYLMPKRNILSMHCSATADLKTGDSSLLFGLSGTGKTTLSADPKRALIGDDEHCWNDNGIFNIEGGCYAKAIDLTLEKEPDIFKALRFGSVLENVVLDDSSVADYTDISITENTRGAYPIEYIDNAKIPCVAGHPTDIIFLTCDAFGVLPPVSRLSPAHAMYHFISGYTAKVAGTEMGITEPTATFSPCFGGPFLVWHPAKYAELLAEMMKNHKANVWLVNTGWSGGGHGVGSRMKLSLTRKIIDSIHSGGLAKVPTQKDPVFGFDVPTSCTEMKEHVVLDSVIVPCSDVSSDVLIPRNAWKDKASYDAQANKLAKLFIDNFVKYENGVSAEVRAASPVVKK